MRTVVARTFCAPADSGKRTCGKAFTPNGPQAARSGEHRVVGVGKIFPDNGFDALVRALRLIPAAEFVIIGEAERGDQQSDREARRLRGLAERLGVADRLRVHAHATDAEIPELLRSADVVACTRRTNRPVSSNWKQRPAASQVVACAVGTSRLRRSTTCSVIPSYGAASVQGDGTDPSPATRGTGLPWTPHASTRSRCRHWPANGRPLPSPSPPCESAARCCSPELPAARRVPWCGLPDAPPR